MRRVVCLVALAAPVPAAPAPASAAPSRLPAFTSCPALVDYARRNLDRPAVPPRVLGPAVGTVDPRPVGAKPAETSGAADAGVPVPAAAVAGETQSSTSSTTNVQEAGVDEPDVVKTDGRRRFGVAGQERRAYDVTQDVPKLLGTVSLEGVTGEILIRGDRVLLIGAAPVAPVAVAAQVEAPTPISISPVPIAPPAPQTRLLEIDVTDPAAMRIARTMTVPGQWVSARLTGGTARVVVTSPATVSDAPDTPVASAAAATKRRPGVSAFVPRTVLRSRITKRTFRRQLVACDDVRHPRAYAGNDLLTVLTIDLDRGLFNVDRDAVLAGAQVVYASPTGLYVASQKSVPIAEDGTVPEGVRTEIHRFDTTQDGETTYASSGSVAGFVLNQYALSEYGGDLRVAATEEPQWASSDPAAQESQSSITVLRERGGSLRQIGRVGGLGRTERIYAARFAGDTAYLVTFRQVDPLYVLDLRDPQAPKVTGELKIPGYSSYLHPLGDDLVLGVGQDQGAQISLFDVRDPAAPRRLAQVVLGAGRSSVEQDPHAFLWWAPKKLALLPYVLYGGANVDQGVIGLQADRAGLREIGRISHGEPWDRPEILRSVVVGDRVLTVSDVGIVASRIDGLTTIGATPY